MDGLPVLSGTRTPDLAVHHTPPADLATEDLAPDLAPDLARDLLVVDPDDPASTFDRACRVVVAYLQRHVPLGSWSVTRHDGERQLVLAATDGDYGLRTGHSPLWRDSYCAQLVAGTGPAVAPDAQAVPAYARAGLNAQLQIGAYVGVPLRWADGRVFGTVCGLDPAPQGEQLTAAKALLDLLAVLLSAILEADRARSESTRRLQQLQMQADTDALTGLYNRRGWVRRLEREETGHRPGDPGAVVVVDLDGLKRVNDGRGHEAGDAHLRLAARALRAAVRDGDVVARLGGDEFGVLAADTRSGQVALLVERVERALEAAGVPASVGAAPYAPEGGFVRAWEQADRAMYEHKQRRRAPRAVVRV